MQSLKFSMAFLLYTQADQFMQATSDTAAPETPEVLFDATPGDSFIGLDGAEWHLVKDEHLQQLFSKQNLIQNGQQKDETQLKAKQFNFPDTFYTSYTGKGEEKGWGLGPGRDYVVFRSVKNDLWMSINSEEGSWMMADREKNGPMEKFKPHFLGDNKVAFKGANDKWLYCNGRYMQADKEEQDSKTAFYVYTTSNQYEGLEEEGDKYIALKSVKYNNFMVSAFKSELYCNRKVLDRWEKWYGWLPPAWSVDKVEIDVAGAIVHFYQPDNGHDGTDSGLIDIEFEKGDIPFIMQISNNKNETKRMTGVIPGQSGVEKVHVLTKQMPS